MLQSINEDASGYQQRYYRISTKMLQDINEDASEYQQRCYKVSMKILYKFLNLLLKMKRCVWDDHCNRYTSPNGYLIHSSLYYKIKFLTFLTKYAPTNQLPIIFDRRKCKDFPKPHLHKQKSLQYNF